MRAWIIEDLGQPPRLASLPDPVPGPGELLIRTRAAGLNFADLLMAEGRYQDRPALPFVPGLELAGTVEVSCPGGPAPGTPVAASLRHGAFAELAVVPLDRILPLPEEMPFSLAAGFQIACGTSHLALSRHVGNLRAGETLFVTGAAGGVGLTAVEIGHQMGARVIASVRGKEKAALARAAGAAEVIQSDSPDLKDQLRRLGGIDVTYDTVGGADFEAALRATRPGGRMLAIGFAGGEVPRVPLNQLLVRNVAVHGFWWSGWLSLAPEAVRESLAELITWWQQGRLSPTVTALPGLASLPEGLEMIRCRRAMGKLVLEIG